MAEGGTNPTGGTRRIEAQNLNKIRTTRDTVDFYGQPRASKFKEGIEAMRH